MCCSVKQYWFPDKIVSAEQTLLLSTCLIWTQQHYLPASCVYIDQLLNIIKNELDDFLLKMTSINIKDMVFIQLLIQIIFIKAVYGDFCILFVHFIFSQSIVTCTLFIKITFTSILFVKIIFILILFLNTTFTCTPFVRIFWVCIVWWYQRNIGWLWIIFQINKFNECHHNNSI